MYNMFKSMGQHRSGPQIHVVPVQAQNSDSDFMEKMMRNSNNDDDMSGMQKMFEMFKNQNRYKRDTDLYDLGDKLLEHYGNEKHMRVKKFMMCNDHMMKMECMCDDSKKMLEKHFKPLSELVEETGMDEMSLLKMTHMLVEDSMDF